MASQFLIEDYAGITVITFTDSSLLDARKIDELATALYRLPDVQNKTKLVVDFTNVKLLASHAIGLLLTLNKKAKALKGQLLLCGVRQEIFKLFQLTNLDKVFQIFADDAAALKHLGVNVK